MNFLFNFINLSPDFVQQMLYSKKKNSFVEKLFKIREKILVLFITSNIFVKLKLNEKVKKKK